MKHKAEFIRTLAGIFQQFFHSVFFNVGDKRDTNVHFSHGIRLTVTCVQNEVVFGHLQCLFHDNNKPVA